MRTRTHTGRHTCYLFLSHARAHVWSEPPLPPPTHTLSHTRTHLLDLTRAWTHCRQTVCEQGSSFGLCTPSSVYTSQQILHSGGATALTCRTQLCVWVGMRVAADRSDLHAENCACVLGMLVAV